MYLTVIQCGDEDPVKLIVSQARKILSHLLPLPPSPVIPSNGFDTFLQNFPERLGNFNGGALITSTRLLLHDYRGQWQSLIFIIILIHWKFVLWNPFKASLPSNVMYLTPEVDQWWRVRADVLRTSPDQRTRMAWDYVCIHRSFFAIS